MLNGIHMFRESVSVGFRSLGGKAGVNHLGSCRYELSKNTFAVVMRESEIESLDGDAGFERSWS